MFLNRGGIWGPPKEGFKGGYKGRCGKRTITTHKRGGGGAPQKKRRVFSTHGGEEKNKALHQGREEGEKKLY